MFNQFTIFHTGKPPMLAYPKGWAKLGASRYSPSASIPGSLRRAIACRGKTAPFVVAGMARAYATGYRRP